QATDTGAHDHTDSLAIGVGDLQAGMTHCLKTGSQAVLNEQVEFSGFLGREIFLDIEPLDRTTKAGGIGGKVHMLKRTDAAAGSQNGLPTARHLGDQRRKHPHTGDLDTSTRHSFVLLFTNGSTREPAWLSSAS